MLGYDYKIIYKKGMDNVVADALSKQYEDMGSLLTLSVPIAEWLEIAFQEWLINPHTTQLIHRLLDDPNPPSGYSWKDDTLGYTWSLVLISTST